MSDATSEICRETPELWSGTYIHTYRQTKWHGFFSAYAIISFAFRARNNTLYTVPTRSLETHKRSLCKKPIFAAFPKIRFLMEALNFFFK